MNRLTGVALIASLLLTACTSQSSAPSAAPATAAATAAPSASQTILITGTFHFVGMDTGCTGTGGYSDISPQTQVTLTNESGTILAVTQLGPTTYPDCLYSFTFGQVPDAKFYSVEVSKRGKITHSMAEVTADRRAFALSLGTP